MPIIENRTDDHLGFAGLDVPANAFVEVSESIAKAMVDSNPEKFRLHSHSWRSNGTCRCGAAKDPPDPETESDEE